VLPDAKAANFSWRCLRHTFGSRLVMAGVDIRTVQELLGHKTIGMTVRYSHASCMMAAKSKPRLQLSLTARLDKRCILAPKHTLAAVERLDALTQTPTGHHYRHQGSSAVGDTEPGVAVSAFVC
jgi:hypothetical protein